MNHDDLRYKGKIPNRVELDGTRVLVPLGQVPSSGSSARPSNFRDAVLAAVNDAVDGTPANPETWPEPVHVAFANLNARNPEALAHFVRIYGTSGMFFDYEEDTGKLIVDPGKVAREQEEFRHVWDVRGAASNLNIRGGTDDLSADLSGGVVKLSVRDLKTFIWVSYLIDRATGKTEVCQYSRCPRQRYFLKVRSDQQFCSTECRSLHHMKVWRSDPKNAERERKQRRKTARKKRRTSAAL